MLPKVAILIDGGFFVKRLPHLRFFAKEHREGRAEYTVAAVNRLVATHLRQMRDELWDSEARGDFKENPYRLLYRCFYYDARPYKEKRQTLIGNKTIDYAKTDEAVFRNELFRLLKRQRNFALRLGEVISDKSWELNKDSLKALRTKEKNVDDLTDDDFRPGFRQKGVDMRLGIDIVSLALKRQVDTIILVTGDADFVPAAKLARREGVRVILDPLWQGVLDDLNEHIDNLRSGFPKPAR